MEIDLAADGGQSGLRMAVARRAGRPARLEEPVAVPGFAWSAGVDQVTAQADALVSAWQELGRPGPVGTLACGLSAMDVDSDRAGRLVAALAARIGARRVLVSGDDVTTHAGALGGRPGVVLNAGTGVICTSIDAAGYRFRVDGWGYLLGDDGGGSWLGREGLRAALAGADRRHAATVLTDRAVDRYGELRAFVHRVLGSPTMVADVAAFARDVLESARADDEVARALCDRAAAELVATSAATVRQAYPDAGPGSVPFAWTGSILTTTDTVRAPLLAALATACPAAAVREPEGGGLEGAARLATTADGPHHARTRQLQRAR